VVSFLTVKYAIVFCGSGSVIFYVIVHHQPRSATDGYLPFTGKLTVRLRWQNSNRRIWSTMQNAFTGTLSVTQLSIAVFNTSAAATYGNHKTRLTDQTGNSVANPSYVEYTKFISITKPYNLTLFLQCLLIVSRKWLTITLCIAIINKKKDAASSISTFVV